MTTAAEIDRMWAAYDEDFLAGRFADADARMRAIDVSTTGPTLAIAILAATLPARDLLPSRAAFVEAVRARRLAAGDDPAEVERVMRGLL